MKHICDVLSAVAVFVSLFVFNVNSFGNLHLDESVTLLLLKLCVTVSLGLPLQYQQISFDIIRRILLLLV